MKISTFVGLSDPSRLLLLVTVDNVIRYLPGLKWKRGKCHCRGPSFKDMSYFRAVFFVLLVTYNSVNKVVRIKVVT